MCTCRRSRSLPGAHDEFRQVNGKEKTENGKENSAT